MAALWEVTDGGCLRKVSEAGPELGPVFFEVGEYSIDGYVLAPESWGEEEVRKFYTSR